MIIDFLPLMSVTRITELSPQYQAAPEPESMSMTWVFGGMALVTVIAVGAFWWWKSIRATDIPDSDALTMDLCREHGLSMAHRGLIDRLAEAAEIDHAAEMFLSKSHFDAIVDQAGQSIRLRRHHQSRLGQIRRILFPT